MRLLTISLAVVAALAITACNSKSSTSTSSSTDQSGAAASAAPAENSAAAGASTAPSGGAESQIPTYPGATTQASGSSSNMGESASGTVMTTDDSFDKVYSWYQQHMPAGSEKSHVTAPMQSAVFTIGDPGNQTSLTITTQGGKTMITIGHVKS